MGRGGGAEVENDSEGANIYRILVEGANTYRI